MLKHGRITVPADYRYEWFKADRGSIQPYAMRLKTMEPLWFAGITNVQPDVDLHERDGFVIVTATTDAGLVDIDDRRPVVFTRPDVVIVAPQAAAVGSKGHRDG
jgi:putative SOS response-associated peptidase YedK